MALMSLGYEEEPIAADAKLNFVLADYAGNELAKTEITAEGTEGDSHTFASSDILSAAESILPDGYAFADASSVTDQTVVYGEDGTVTVPAGKVATLTVTYTKLFGKSVGPVTLTKVQTSSAAKAAFTAAEIRAAVPAGYRALSLIGTSVPYGSQSSKTVLVY